MVVPYTGCDPFIAMNFQKDICTNPRMMLDDIIFMVIQRSLFSQNTVRDPNLSNAVNASSNRGGCNSCAWQTQHQRKAKAHF